MNVWTDRAAVLRQVNMVPSCEWQSRSGRRVIRTPSTHISPAYIRQRFRPIVHWRIRTVIIRNQKLSVNITRGSHALFTNSMTHWPVRVALSAALGSISAASISARPTESRAYGAESQRARPDSSCQIWQARLYVSRSGTADRARYSNGAWVSRNKGIVSPSEQRRFSSVAAGSAGSASRR
ncbi:hypothetical protein FKP32DRAFT_318323 [Trametes sanguinea]|nr:hypothetical protein FKP32DRAFT_318323 [Trametes sanguinea]